MPLVDGDGFFVDGSMDIEAGAIWRIGDGSFDAEVRLDADDGWIEIGEEALAEYFEEVDGE